MEAKRPTEAKRTGVLARLPVIRAKVAGIDLAAEEHWVCGPVHNEGEANVRRFGTRTHELEALANWLEGRRCGVGGDGKHERILDPHLRIAGSAGV